MASEVQILRGRNSNFRSLLDMLTAQTAVLLATYLRMLGYEARAHTASSSDVDLGRLAVAAGLARVEGGTLVNPYVGARFGLARVTTTLEQRKTLVFETAWRHGRARGEKQARLMKQRPRQTSVVLAKFRERPFHQLGIRFIGPISRSDGFADFR